MEEITVFTAFIFHGKDFGFNFHHFFIFKNKDCTNEGLIRSGTNKQLF